MHGFMISNFNEKKFFFQRLAIFHQREKKEIIIILHKIYDIVEYVKPKFVTKSFQYMQTVKITQDILDYYLIIYIESLFELIIVSSRDYYERTKFCNNLHNTP